MTINREFLTIPKLISNFAGNLRECLRIVIRGVNEWEFCGIYENKRSKNFQEILRMELTV